MKSNIITILCTLLITAGLVFIGYSLSVKGQYQIIQSDSAFARFNKKEGELCFISPVPNPKTNEIAFLTDSWVCMPGNKTKNAQAISIDEFKNAMQEAIKESQNTKQKGRK